MKRTLVWILVIFLFTACNRPATLKKHKVDDLYSIQVPDYLEETYEQLGEDQSLELGSDSKDVYVMVFNVLKHEVDSMGIGEFYEMNEQFWAENSDAMERVDAVRDTMLGNLPAHGATLRVTVDAEDAFVHVLAISGEQHWHQIYVTYGDGIMEKHFGEEVVKAVYSFEEL